MLLLLHVVSVCLSTFLSNLNVRLCLLQPHTIHRCVDTRTGTSECDAQAQRHDHDPHHRFLPLTSSYIHRLFTCDLVYLLGVRFRAVDLKSRCHHAGLVPLWLAVRNVLNVVKVQHLPQVHLFSLIRRHVSIAHVVFLQHRPFLLSLGPLLAAIVLLLRGELQEHTQPANRRPVSRGKYRGPFFVVGRLQVGCSCWLQRRGKGTLGLAALVLAFVVLSPVVAFISLVAVFLSFSVRVAHEVQIVVQSQLELLLGVLQVVSLAGIQRSSAPPRDKPANSLGCGRTWTYRV
mmetsp:Transcript_38522/g.96500  ORF Transcript_38522/g.96500 Transcript_38522/m.96500 type:complete len:289 (+) Transcript_38522:282-1148(+)